MTCFHPLTAYKPPRGGKLQFSPSSSGSPISIACGQCIGCRLDYSRSWAVRAYHESQMHDVSCFITLTYDDDRLPDPPSLQPMAVVRWLKRLRKRLPVKVRYMLCGEYGDLNGRPHYHVVIFGFSFPDRQFYKKSPTGVDLYTSDLLSLTWPFGHCDVSDFSFKAAAYVARYITKKVTGRDSADAYEFPLLDGSFVQLFPPFFRASRMPGLGRPWFDKYKNDLRHDYVVVDGIKHPLPKYYDKCLPVDDLAVRKYYRSEAALAKGNDHITCRRLRDRETVKLSQLQSVKRS